MKGELIMQKVVGYMRVSSQGQMSGNGINRQSTAIKEYAGRNNMQLETVFSDLGVSGTIKERTGLNDMFEYCQRNNIKYIIIEKLDRLARDLIVSEYIIREITRKGITLISCQEGSDLGSKDASRTLIRQIFSSVAEYDKGMIVSKLKLARDKIRKETGKCEGSKGYKETDTDTIKLVKSLRRKPRNSYKKKMTYNAIANHLNNNNVKTMRGKCWNYNSVKHILSL